MKKKLLCFIFAFCLIIPAIFCLSACGKEKEPEEKKYVITYIVDGLSYSTYETRGNEIISLPSNPEKEGYTFCGWYLDQEYEENFDNEEYKNTSISEDFNVFAKFTINKYTISFNIEGSIRQTITQDYGTSISEPEISVKYGYDFVGWFENSNYTQRYTFTTMPAKSFTLYGKYEAIFKLSGSSIIGLSDYAAKKTTVVIPDEIDGKQITSIADEAFKDNDGYLTSVTIGKNIQTIGKKAFMGSLSWGSSLKNLNILSDNLVIGDSAFYYNTNLKTVTITGKVSEVKDFAFAGCSALTEIEFPSGLTSLGKQTFGNCTTLSGVVLPNTLETFGESVFYNCTTLESIDIPTGLKIIGAKSFLSCTNLKTVNIPNGLETIAESVFMGCASLKTISLPSSLVSIGNKAFHSCESLENVTLSENLESIGEYAFAYCDKLNFVHIKGEETVIASNAFTDNTQLKTVIIDSETIANNLTSSLSYNYLVFYASTIYVKENLTIANSTFLSENFTKQTISDKTGYDMYVKNS